ncbi:MAG: immunoglobulin domain-containing protein [Verrucomicrobia bacterium]|nr:immunoglobulin domain-containing protein [Verrucomicrobiota bacterium]
MKNFLNSRAHLRWLLASLWLLALVPAGAQVSIVTQPASVNATTGDTVSFTISAFSPTGINYQWRLNGANLPGQTGSTLTFTNAQATNAGDYSAVAFDNTTAVNSAVATLLFTNVPVLPVTDNFADRLALLPAAGGVGRGDTLAATNEPGEPLPDGQIGGGSVWFKWTPPVSGIATFTTRGSGFDTLLALYTGTNLAGLTPVNNGSDDDEAGFLTSAVAFNAVAGTEYQLVLDGAHGARGNFTLSWNLEPTTDRLPEILTQPAVLNASEQNQDLTVITDNNVTPATFQWTESGQPLPGETNATLLFTGPASKKVGSYRLVITSLTNVTRVVRSKTARVQFSDADSAGNLNARAYDKFLPSADPASPPSLAGGKGKGKPPGAAPAGGYTGSQIFSTFAAAKEPGEPNHCNEPGGSSYWYAYTPTKTGSLSVDTAGSTYDNVLAVYGGPGDSFTTLVSLGCSKSIATNPAVPVVFNATNGVTYYIVLDGVGGASGKGYLNYALTAPPTITLAPQAAAYQAGEAIDIYTTYAGYPGPTGQLRFNGTNLPGAFSSGPTLLYQIGSFSNGLAGTYDLVVANPLGSVTSAPAKFFLLQSNQARFVNPIGSNGLFTTTIISQRDTNYVVQYSTNLSNWISLRTNRVPSGVTNFLDPEGALYPRRFFRITN